MKVSSFAVLAFALMLVLAGFVAGWTLGLERPPFSPRQEVMGQVDQNASTTAEPTMPSEDVTGDDVSGLPRYPGSVRIEHAREDLGGLTATEVEYLTPTDLDTVRDFYRDAFRTGDWNVADVSFSEGAWTFFVTRDEREVFLEIKPYGGLTEVDFELTEPGPDDTPPETPDREEPQGEKPSGEDAPSEAERAPEPPREPEPGPQPPAQAWSPPPAASSASPAPASPAPGSSVAPSSASAYDDDDDFEDFEDDD